MGKVWEWGAEVGQSWRTTGDLGMPGNLSASMYGIGFGQNGIEKWAGPGHWNDPDYVLIGWITWEGAMRPTPLTPNEQYTHVSLWSLMASPLIFSGDMTRLDDFTLSLLTNDEVLEVNLDPLGRQAGRVAKNGEMEVWAKDMEDGSKAVGLFNRGEVAGVVTARWADLGVTGKSASATCGARRTWESSRSVSRQASRGTGRWCCDCSRRLEESNCKTYSSRSP